ncbi:SEC-C domain-containing protein [Rhizobium leguminosarum]|uniref:SEC-C domain-containing protein n=1 Tax=Rhizobium leguminosarum TaxID=384 RepID=UPI001C9193B5|nr:SEC-C domain-containing protein [Rhizobium leguminosarum]MBY2937940.1 SEC-C domain-containing protein [Rhizobium leguminosarum]
MTTNYRPTIPTWSQPCHCGSDKKFGNCCRNRLPGFDIGKKYTKECDKEHWELALLATRADITQYTIWHNSHTAPVTHHESVVGYMLWVDINALGSYLERLQWLYDRTGRLSNWLETLDRLRNNIQHRSWYRKIAYYRALFFLRPGYDVAEARRELKKAGPITLQETDVQILQIFIDLEFQRLTFADRLKYLDRILEVSKDLGDQLQYRASKAVQYFLIGDARAAEELFSEVVELGRKPENLPLTKYQRHMYVRAFQHLGMLRHDSKILEESISTFNEIMMDGSWTPIGQAAIYREIAECYKFLEQWHDAETTVRTGLDLHDTPIDRIHLAEALLYQKKATEACAEIDRLKPAELLSPALDDYCLAYAAIAIWSEDQQRLGFAKAHLESYNPDEPYFRERRLNLLLTVNEGISKQKISQDQKDASAPKGGFLALLSKFLMVQPNFGGIGLNFNAIFEELAKRKAPVSSVNNEVQK